MKLIDADKFKAYMQDNYVLYDHTLADIDAQPAVEAIPIEWLINKCNEADNMGMGIDDWSVKDCYELVLEDWEKENERP